MVMGLGRRAGSGSVGDLFVAPLRSLGVFQYERARGQGSCNKAQKTQGDAATEGSQASDSDGACASTRDQK